MKIIKETILDMPKSCEADEIVSLALWYFFTGTEDKSEPGINNLYEFRYVDTREEAGEIYLVCSEVLFEDEAYINSLLSEGKSDKLAEFLAPLSRKIEKIKSNQTFW